MTGQCYACGKRGNRARDCRQQNGGYQYADGGFCTVNAVAAGIMACVSNYERGGIEALPAPALHEPMDDPDCEMSAAKVYHIAINLASDMISEADMVNCGKLAPRTVPKAESVQQVIKETSERPTMATTSTSDQHLTTKQSHNQIS